MKLRVEGVEEIEITDPAGLCNPPVPQQGIPPQPQRGQPVPPNILPSQPQVWPTPPLPTPFSPTPLPAIPRDWGIPVPHRPPIYTRHVHDPHDPLMGEEWGLGGPMIQQAGQDVDPDKWEKNWQAKMGQKPGGITEIKQEEDGNQHTH